MTSPKTAHRRNAGARRASDGRGEIPHERRSGRSVPLSLAEAGGGL